MYTTPGSLSLGSIQAHRIAITGVTGQLGRHVLDEIAVWPGTQILALIRAGTKPFTMPANVRFEVVNYLDSGSITTALNEFQPTAVVHCAATGMLHPRPDWSELVGFNVNVSAQLCECARDIPGCHFVYISSGLAYRDQGRPLCENDPMDSNQPYAASKIAAEALVGAIARESGMRLAIIRPFSFSGIGDKGSRLFPSLLRAADEGHPLNLSPGGQFRDHSATKDIARAIALTVARRNELPDETQIFNLGSGKIQPLRALIEDVVHQLGLVVNLNFGARDYTLFEPKYVVADNTRARTLLDWRPQTNFAFAIWELAKTSFPNLQLQQPKRFL